MGGTSPTGSSCRSDVCRFIHPRTRSRRRGLWVNAKAAPLAMTMMTKKALRVVESRQLAVRVRRVFFLVPGEWVCCDPDCSRRTWRSSKEQTKTRLALFRVRYLLFSAENRFGVIFHDDRHFRREHVEMTTNWVNSRDRERRIIFFPDIDVLRISISTAACEKPEWNLNEKTIFL